MRATPKRTTSTAEAGSGFLPILEGSGILTPPEFEAVRSRVLRAELPSDSVALADRLVADGVLTEFQARRVLDDNARGLGTDRYVILDSIGKGGMGRIYKARHRLMGRVVAVKVIAPALRSSPQKVALFRREMELIARLDHPNIVRAHDADWIAGVLCLVMEYVPGQDLAQRAREAGTLPPAEVADFAAQAARGLAHAHARGIVHRDVKPDNLLLTDEGVIKLLDLGLGALMDTADVLDADVASAGKTVGTVEFISPEQASSSRVDGRSDLYSLGCSMYYLLTGRFPFTGATQRECLGARLRGRPQPIHQLLPDLPGDYVRVLDRLMAPRPERRYPNADEAAEALTALARGPVTPPPPVGRHQRAAEDLDLEISALLSEAPAPPPDPIAAHRLELEESGAASGRSVAQSYQTEVIRLHNAEIDRLSRALDQARREAETAATTRSWLERLARSLWDSLLDEQSHARTLLLAIIILLLLGLLFAQTMG
ncbi:MAG TPA: serine/threonine-protein kinase [Isosphaeraceae bacterium]|nr:serine/threonine-protein kinase [Isosphaeraceae bacterium]